MRPTRLMLRSAAVLAVVCAAQARVAFAETPPGSKAYTANASDDTVSVIDLVTMQEIGTRIAVGNEPRGCAVTPSGALVFVANRFDATVSVISTATDAVTTTITLTGTEPYNLAVTPDGQRVYVICKGSSTVSVVSVATLLETSSIDLGVVGASPEGIAITPDGSKVYVVNRQTDNVSVIATASNTVVAGPIPVGSSPRDAAASPDGSRVIVVGEGAPVVILTATDTASATVFPDIGNQRDVDMAGTRAIVTNFNETLDVYDLATETFVSSVTLGGSTAYGVVVAPDATTAWVANQDSNDLREVNLGTLLETGRNLTLSGSEPRAVGAMFPAAAADVPSYFIPKTVRLKIRGAGGDSLKAAGVFDDGGATVDYAQDVTLEIGSFSQSFRLVPNRKGTTFTFKSDDLSVVLRPNRADSSRGSFVVKISKATLTIPLNGPVELVFRAAGLVDASSVVTLRNGGFLLGAVVGDLESPPFFPTRVTATVNATKPDKITLKAGFSTSAEAPLSLGDVVVSVGPDFTVTIPGAEFTTKSAGVFIHTSKDEAKQLSVRVDFRSELLTLSAKGYELGTLAGPTTDVVFDPGDGRGPITAVIRLGGGGASRRY